MNEFSEITEDFTTMTLHDHDMWLLKKALVHYAHVKLRCGKKDEAKEIYALKTFINEHQ